MLLAGLALFTLAGIATTAAPNAWTLVIARVLQSIGACSGLVLGRAIVRDSAAAGPRGGTARHADAGDVGGARDRAGAGRLCHRLARLARRLRSAGDHRRSRRSACAVLLLPETNRLQSSARASMLLGSLRLFRSRAFCGYVLGGACTTTSFYAFMAASPFILVDLLHQPTERVGLYYLLLMAGVAAGSLSANRVAGRIRHAGGAAAGQFDSRSPARRLHAGRPRPAG